VPPPLLERLALEFLRVLVLVVFVFVLVIGALPADDLELQTQRAGRRLDRAHVERAQQHEHTNELGLVHLPRWLRIDQHLHVRRAFGQLSNVVMLNAGLAPRANFKSTS
jgi:hypothetical protein